MSDGTMEAMLLGGIINRLSRFIVKRGLAVVIVPGDRVDEVVCNAYDRAASKAAAWKSYADHRDECTRCESFTNDGDDGGVVYRLCPEGRGYRDAAVKS